MEILFGLLAGGAIFLFFVLPILWMVLALGLHFIATAWSLFEWAAEGGFVGVALYIILWVVAFPIMLTVCLIGGAVRLVSAMRPAGAVARAGMLESEPTTVGGRIQRFFDYLGLQGTVLLIGVALLAYGIVFH